MSFKGFLTSSRIDKLINRIRLNLLCRFSSRRKLRRIKLIFFHRDISEAIGAKRTELWCSGLFQGTGNGQMTLLIYQCATISCSNSIWDLGRNISAFSSSQKNKNTSFLTCSKAQGHFSRWRNLCNWTALWLSVSDSLKSPSKPSLKWICNSAFSTEPEKEKVSCSSLSNKSSKLAGLNRRRFAYRNKVWVVCSAKFTLTTKIGFYKMATKGSFLQTGPECTRTSRLRSTRMMSSEREKLFLE